MGQENFKKKVTPKTPSEVELEKWKQNLALEEAEIKELEEKIRKMVKKTKSAGVLSWKIAKAYMQVGIRWFWLEAFPRNGRPFFSPAAHRQF